MNWKSFQWNITNCVITKHIKTQTNGLILISRKFCICPLSGGVMNNEEVVMQIRIPTGWAGHWLRAGSLLCYRHYHYILWFKWPCSSVAWIAGLDVTPTTDVPWAPWTALTFVPTSFHYLPTFKTGLRRTVMFTTVSTRRGKLCRSSYVDWFVVCVILLSLVFFLLLRFKYCFGFDQSWWNTGSLEYHQVLLLINYTVSICML